MQSVLILVIQPRFSNKYETTSFVHALLIWTGQDLLTAEVSSGNWDGWALESAASLSEPQNVSPNQARNQPD
jgi:hypothetical protein